MHRFFTEQITDRWATITGEDVRHIGRVLRLTRGDRVQLCDGRGQDYDAVIAEVTDEAVTLSVGAPYPSATEPTSRVTLFQCLPKVGKMETIVQKCTELGAAAIVPVVSARCVALPGGNYDNKRVRYQRVAMEAAKQSRRGVIPEFGSLQTLDRLDPKAFDLFLMAYEDETETGLKQLFSEKDPPGRMGLLIGPEGGFTPEEAALLREKGARTVSLGPRILRTETAGMAMLAMVLFQLGQ